MRVELAMTVRGGDRVLRWDDGVLTGDDEVLRRLRPLIEHGQVEVDDLLSVVRGAELVTAQHVSLSNLDLVDPDVPPPATGARPDRRTPSATLAPPTVPA